MEALGSVLSCMTCHQSRGRVKGRSAFHGRLVQWLQTSSFDDAARFQAIFMKARLTMPANHSRWVSLYVVQSRLSVGLPLDRKSDAHNQSSGVRSQLWVRDLGSMSLSPL